MLHVPKPTFLVPKYGRKIWCQSGAGGMAGQGGHPWEKPHLSRCVCAPPDEGPMWTWKEDMGVSLYTKSQHVLQHLIPTVWYLSQFLLRGGSLTMMNIAYGLTETSVTIWAAQWNTLSRQVGHVGRATRNI